MTGLHLRTRLEPRGPAAAVLLTDEQVAALGGGKTPPVRFTVNGTTVDGRIGRMGGQNLLGFNKAVRERLGVTAGDEVSVTIELAAGPPPVDVPADLAAVLDADPALRAAFDALAPSHRKEHARSVADAKRPETRQRRIAAVVGALSGS